MSYEMANLRERRIPMDDIDYDDNKKWYTKKLIIGGIAAAILLAILIFFLCGIHKIQEGMKKH